MCSHKSLSTGTEISNCLHEQLGIFLFSTLLGVNNTVDARVIKCEPQLWLGSKLGQIFRTAPCLHHRTHGTQTYVRILWLMVLVNLGYSMFMPDCPSV